MAQPSVKILFSTSHRDLDGQLAAWLEETAGEVTLRGLSMDSNEYGHCLAVLYAPEPGPVYWGQVLFATRHDTLAEEANGLLAEAGDGGPRFMAVGSNKYGHALCLIGVSEGPEGQAH